MKLRIHSDKNNFGIWIPLFIIGPIVLVLLLAIFLACAAVCFAINYLHLAERLVVRNDHGSTEVVNGLVEFARFKGRCVRRKTVLKSHFIRMHSEEDSQMHDIYGIEMYHRERSEGLLREQNTKG